MSNNASPEQQQHDEGGCGLAEVEDDGKSGDEVVESRSRSHEPTDVATEAFEEREAEEQTLSHNMSDGADDDGHKQQPQDNSGACATMQEAGGSRANGFGPETPCGQLPILVCEGEMGMQSSNLRERTMPAGSAGAAINGASAVTRHEAEKVQ